MYSLGFGFASQIYIPGFATVQLDTVLNPDFGLTGFNHEWTSTLRSVATEDGRMNTNLFHIMAPMAGRSTNWVD